MWIGVDVGGLTSGEIIGWAERVEGMGGIEVGGLLRRIGEGVAGRVTGDGEIGEAALGVMCAGDRRMVEVESRVAGEIERMAGEARRRSREAVFEGAGMVTREMARKRGHSRRLVRAGELVDAGDGMGEEDNALSSPSGDTVRAVPGVSASASAVTRRVRRMNDVTDREGEPREPNGTVTAIPCTGETVKRKITARIKEDAEYANTFEAWAGSRLRSEGVSMRRIGNLFGMTPGEVWKRISAYGRYWKRMGSSGVVPDAPSEAWVNRYNELIRTNGKSEGTRDRNGQLRGGGKLKNKRVGEGSLTSPSSLAETVDEAEARIDPSAPTPDPVPDSLSGTVRMRNGGKGVKKGDKMWREKGGKMG